MFFWRPDLSFGVFPCCPSCKSAGKPKGWTSRPRRLYSADGGTEYLVSYEYECRTASCPRSTFLGSVHDSLKLMPFWVSSQFPYILTKRSGCHRDLLLEILQEGERGHGPGIIANKLAEKSRTLYARHQTEYTSLLSYRLEEKEHKWTLLSTLFPTGSKQRAGMALPGSSSYPLFPAYNDRKSYNGGSPSGERQQAPVRHHSWLTGVFDLSAPYPNYSRCAFVA